MMILPTGNKRGFTPLEKAAGFNRWSADFYAGGGLIPSAKSPVFRPGIGTCGMCFFASGREPWPLGRGAPLPPSAKTVKGRSSLTGFTLIEIMISVAILSVGLIMVLQGFSYAFNILRISRDNLETSLLAQEKMAEMEVNAKQKKDAFLDDVSGASRSGNIEFNWRIRLTPDKEYEDLYEAVTTVSWKEGRRDGSSIFSTYLTIPHDKQ
ncbi:MAG: prepilin-type N-terminal cleavage/methylation domain-containing protein [Candidatus Omnitrophota bacterium]|jgi:prepilin-type N-terminal cleavage/methylation domain-containing protein